MTGNILVLGVGNPLMGDDALGILAVEMLRARPDLPTGIDLVDGGTEGIGLIPLMASYQCVMVVDAVMMNLPAGTIQRFVWQEARVVKGEHSLSLHQSDLTDALILAETLKCLPPEVVIYGVQPQNTAWDDLLSPAVERALPALVDLLIQEIRSRKDDGSKDTDY